MRSSAKRNGGRPSDPDAYWRRRFFILGGGIAVLAVLAWRFTPAHPGPAPGAAADARSSAAAATAGAPLPSAAYGSAWPGPSPTPTPTPPSSPSPTPPAVASAAVGDGRCTPANIVLSLFTSQASYRNGEQPQFRVYAVSTAPGTCGMPFGPGSVHVIVTSHGHVVWDSSACKPAAAATARFQLGVPQLLTITWNRAAARPAGCAGSLPAGTSGTFQAVAMSAGESSSVRSFTLLR